MKFTILPISIIYLLTSLQYIQAQNIQGITFDEVSNEAIPFVNIGIVGSNIGTVSDELGHFTLSLDMGLGLDTLRFSTIGYESVDIFLNELRRDGMDSLVVLNAAAIDINEIVISSRRLSSERIGVPKKKCFPIPFYKGVISDVPFPQEAYRHEIGTQFQNDEQIKLDSVLLHFTGVPNDTFEFRINVYTYQGGSVTNVLSEPIYIRLTRSKSLASPVIDLSDLNLWFEGDFLVTIENYKELEDDSIRILANFRSIGRNYQTIYRSSTQSKFEVLKSKSDDFGLSIVAFIKQ